MIKKKRNKIIMALCAMIVAISVTIVPSAFALTIQEGSVTPYYITVGARETDFCEIYVDNTYNTVMWVFDPSVCTGIVLFNDYNFVASGMMGSIQMLTIDYTSTTKSFMLGGFINSNTLPSSNYFTYGDYFPSDNLFYNENYPFASTLAYSGFSSSYAYTNLDRMSTSTNYWQEAVKQEGYKPCIIMHLASTYSIDSFNDYAVLGCAIQLLEVSFEQQYQDGYNSGYNSGFVNGNADKVNYGSQLYEDGKNDGWQEFYDNDLGTYVDIAEENGYNTGFNAGQDYFIETYLPNIKLNEYNQGLADGKSQGQTGFLDLFTAIFDAPVSALTSLLNFDILGVNMSSFFLSILSLAVIICIVRWLI